MKTIAFIPVRCGSKSIPFKNIKPFCGKPLVYWVLKAAVDCKKIDLIYVSTDCDEIEEVVTSFSFGNVKVHKRALKNAQDTSATEDVMLEFLAENSHLRNAIFVLLQATSPLVTSDDLDKAFLQYGTDKPDTLLSCVRIKRFLWGKDGKPLNYDYTCRPRRQDFEGILVENGAFYISPVADILKHKNRLSGKVSIYEMPEYTYVELDEEDDWVVAENLMKKHLPVGSDSPKKVKLFISDLDGVLTDGGVYYSEKGESLVKFNRQDGKGFEILKKTGVKTAIITSEDSELNAHRTRKLKIDYYYKGIKDKLRVVEEICSKEKISLSEIAFIGDDINDKALLELVGSSACPSNAVTAIKSLAGIHLLSRKGGNGAVREFVDYLDSLNCF